MPEPNKLNKPKPFILRFPVQGIDKSRTPEAQPEGTSPDLLNMRPFDVADERFRGGQRPGLTKWSATLLGADEQPIVAICSVSSVE